MDRRQLKPERLLEWAKKYKFALLVLLLGVALLLWPTKDTRDRTEQTPQQSETAQEVKTAQAEQSMDLQQFQQKLQSLLRQVDGAGQVQVQLTLKAGPQYLYQKDFNQSDSAADGTTQKQLQESTVVVSAGNAQQEALLSQVIYPKFQGAVILCQGADNAAVKLDLVNAVASLTGLSTDKITVIKMKGN